MQYNIYFGVYNQLTYMYDFSSLLADSKPLSNNYSYNVTGLVLNKKYAFMHSATNIYGTSSNSS